MLQDELQWNVETWDWKQFFCVEDTHNVWRYRFSFCDSEMCDFPALIRKQLGVINIVYLIRLLYYPTYYICFISLNTQLDSGRLDVHTFTSSMTTSCFGPCCSCLFPRQQSASLLMLLFSVGRKPSQRRWNTFWLWEVNHCSSGGLQLFSLTSPLLADRGWFPSLRDSGV